jgi:TRAP-type C4-dicarboxylate transport system substrate-binding protein
MQGRLRMLKTRNMLLRTMGMALAGGMMTALLAPAPAQAQAPIVMKLSTATLNDTQHEYFKRFAAAVEKDSGGRIKGEVYPASQLGPIPRQIEGVQFGSIQGWMGPPEFLVGIDVRYETLSAPGLFTSYAQYERVIGDPVVQKMLFDLGAAKGLEGVGLVPIGPSSIVMRKEVKTLADLKGSKIRVLASPFQLELIRRMDASPVAMTLADVLPGIQQGAIDGALGRHHGVDAVPVSGRGEIRDGERPALRQLDRRAEQALAHDAAAGPAKDRAR